MINNSPQQGGNIIYSAESQNPDMQVQSAAHIGTNPTNPTFHDLKGIKVKTITLTIQYVEFVQTLFTFLSLRGKNNDKEENKNQDKNMNYIFNLQKFFNIVQEKKYEKLEDLPSHLKSLHQGDIFPVTHSSHITKHKECEKLNKDDKIKINLYSFQEKSYPYDMVLKEGLLQSTYFSGLDENKKKQMKRYIESIYKSCSQMYNQEVGKTIDLVALGNNMNSISATLEHATIKSHEIAQNDIY